MYKIKHGKNVTIGAMITINLKKVFDKTNIGVILQIDKGDNMKTNKDRLILSELYNYECFWVGEPLNCREGLEGHNDITDEDIFRVYNKNEENAYEAMGW